MTCFYFLHIIIDLRSEILFLTQYKSFKNIIIVGYIQGSPDNRGPRQQSWETGEGEAPGPSSGTEIRGQRTCGRVAGSDDISQNNFHSIFHTIGRKFNTTE